MKLVKFPQAGHALISVLASLVQTHDRLAIEEMGLDVQDFFELVIDHSEFKFLITHQESLMGFLALGRDDKGRLRVTYTDFGAESANLRALTRLFRDGAALLGEPVYVSDRSQGWAKKFAIACGAKTLSE